MRFLLKWLRYGDHALSMLVAFVMSETEGERIDMGKNG
jgi:hypothetical protein